MSIRIFLLILFVLLNSSCSTNNPELNESEKIVVNEVGLNEELALLLKSHSNKNELHQLTHTESDWPTPTFAGISIHMSEKEANKLLKQYNKLKEKGYLLFRSDMNFGIDPDEVSVIKSDDHFDILRFSGTDGINYGLYPIDIINKLKEWERIYPFQIIGADFDWVEVQFLKENMDLDMLAKEIYEFCPDVVDQGTGTVDLLEKEMEQNNGFYLWWD